MAERTQRSKASRRRAQAQLRPGPGPLSLTRMMPLLVAAGVLLIVGFVLMALAVRSSGKPTAVAGPGPSHPASSRVVAVAGTVEVPAVAGSSFADAQLILDTAGFKVSVSYEEQAASAPGTVLGQDPAPGVLVPTGGSIRLVVSGNRAAANAPLAETVAARETTQVREFVVVIDPGHQARSDQGLESIGPGSKVKKGKSAGGTTGVATHVPEYEVALQISTNLAARLKQAGVKVIMTRSTNDVNLSNAERAAIANRAHADLFVRVHGNSSPDPQKAGVSTLYPASNQWTRPYAETSRQAAVDVEAAVLSATEALDNGVHPRGDLAGFNYARVPSLLVECGFLSNEVEDRLLTSPHYQDKVAQGIADGVLAYLDQIR